ncbi:endonuclease V [Actinophytocola sp.]|uniref:endonuclease V n=1 Tax=Actinophytocola sp. TaxID=1872138 RepID=UPI002EDAD14A
MSLPRDPEEAVALQRRLAPRVVRVTPPGFAPRTATGLDVAYATGSDAVAAAAVTVDLATGAELGSATATGESDFPYVPGLFAFRELPILLEALGRLGRPPELLVADGHGIAHPRRFGLACHLGIETGLPAIGVAKTPLGHYDPPAQGRGATSLLLDGGQEVGAALRTQDGVKPVFVSVGHQLDLATACRLVLTLARAHRLPETTRLADQLSRRTLDEAATAPSRVALFGHATGTARRIAVFCWNPADGVTLELLDPEWSRVATGYFEHGVEHYRQRRMVTPREGPVFMRALLQPFRMSYYHLADESDQP